MLFLEQVVHEVLLAVLGRLEIGVGCIRDPLDMVLVVTGVVVFGGGLAPDWKHFLEAVALLLDGLDIAGFPRFFCLVDLPEL